MKTHRSRARVGATIAAGLSAVLAFSALAAAPAIAAPAIAAPVEGSTETISSEAAGTIAVDGAQLEWGYSRYAQYGVFGAWSMKASGADVSTGVVDGKAVSGLDADAGRGFNVVRFDDGEGSIDETTGAGTITWDETGDWVLNAYNGQYGAPDETLRDPILTIDADGTGELSFEAYIPAGLDMSGNPAPASGPTRIALATFSSVTVTDGVITAVPEYAGRSYTPAVGSPWQECAGAGGAWPSEWIDFVPASVQAHYYTTSCSGLNLMKPPLDVTVTLDAVDVAISTQPVATTVDAGQTATFSVNASGNPLGYQWQKSTDGASWTDLDGATNSVLSVPTTSADDGSLYRVSINGAVTSDEVALTVTSAAPVLRYDGSDLVVYVGSPAARFSAYAEGTPAPTEQWQTSTDGGTTWTNAGEAGPVGTEYVVDDPQAADSGLLARAVFDNGLGTVTSAPKKLTVVDFDGPSSMWVQGAPLTLDEIAEGDTDLRASFAGFTVPADSTTNIQAALVPESALEGTNTPDLADAIWSETLYASNLQQYRGHQPGQLVRAWGTIDPSIRYYLVTYSEDLNDRSYDSRLLLPIEGQTPDATPITAATVEFGFNNVHQGGSPAGGCNYFVAGTVQGLGSDYSSVDGNVYVVKKLADGSSQVVDAASRCTPPEGSTTIDQRFLFTAGQGSSSADGTEIQWTGAGTVNAYGGLVSWYFQNPKLVLDAAGDGSITARVGGFGSSMDNPDVKVPLDPREGVEIATVKGATIVDGTISIDPVWKGVDYFPLTVAGDPTSPRSTTSAIPQAAKDANPNWGSWPESFVDFQYATGLSSYWHTSGLSADPQKPPLPIEVAFEGSAPDYGVLINAQPTPAVLTEGDDVTFSGGATSASGDVSFQWQAKKAGGDWADIDGATSAQLTLTDVTVAEWNGAAVRFVASSGDDSVTSGEATITVTAPVAAAFVTQPTDVATLVDSSGYFSAVVGGYPLPTVQWQRQAADGSWTDVTAGAGSWASGDTLNAYFNYYPATLADDGAKFRAIATNASGSVTSDVVTLSVSTQPAAIIGQPRDLVMFEGGNGYIALASEGAPTPTVSWEKSTDGGQSWADAGVAGDFIDFPSVTADMDGDQYRATVSNEFATVVSDVATVRVLADAAAAVDPGLIDPAVDNTVHWVLGRQPALPAGANGVFVAGIVEKSVWQPGDAPVQPEDLVTGTAGRYGPGDWSYGQGYPTIAAGTLDPSKEYGFAWQWVPADGTSVLPQFDVYVPIALGSAPAISAQPVSAAVSEGEPAAFEVTASATPAPGYQWQLKSGDDWTDIDGATSARLELSAAIGDDDGTAYRVVVSNELGSVISDEATLTVTPAEPAGPPTTTPAPLSDDQLTDAARGPVTVVSIDGRVVTLSLGDGFDGQWVGAEVHSTPVFLGWQQVSTAGTIVVTLPEGLAAGEHKLAVRAADESLIGWAAITVAAGTDGGGSGTDGDGSGTGVGTGTDGSGSGSGTATTSGSGSSSAALSNTGLEAGGWVLTALLLLVVGAGAVTARRLRKS